MPSYSEVEVFPWNNNFNTGIEVIDQQHKKLVDIINRLARSLAKEAPALETDSLLNELFEYAEYHFSSEEHEWKKGFENDAFLKLHQESHQSFIENTSNIKKRFLNDRSHDVQNEILQFLINWLTHHILEDDMTMAKTLHAVVSGLSLDEAKKRAADEMSESVHVFIDTLMMMYSDLSSRALELLRERNKREKIEKDLNKAQQQEKIFTDHVTQSIPGMLFVYDENRELIRWNTYYEDILGYSPSELMGKKFVDIVSPSLGLDEILEDILNGKQAEFEQNIKYHDGREKTYLMKAVPFKVNDHNGFLGTGINISKLKTAERKLEQEAKQTKMALKGIIFSVSKAMEAQDSYTAIHQRNVARIAVAIALKLELNDDQVEGIELGASIHDIGKMAIPLGLLVKPNKLNTIELELVKTHATAGVNILEDVEFPWNIKEMIAQHHERLDGTGYPQGLKGERICVEARIIAVADVFEAMSAHRPYRPALGQASALGELIRFKGIKYDERAVEALNELLQEQQDRFDYISSA